MAMLWRKRDVECERNTVKFSFCEFTWWNTEIRLVTHYLKCIQFQWRNSVLTTYFCKRTSYLSIYIYTDILKLPTFIITITLTACCIIFLRGTFEIYKTWMPSSCTFLLRNLIFSSASSLWVVWCQVLHIFPLWSVEDA